MRILVFGETYFNYTDSSVYALKKLGHDVKVVYMPLLHKSKLSLSEYIKYKLKDKRFISEFYSKCSLGLISVLDEFKPDIFISINGNIYWEFINMEVLAKAREIGTITVAWYVDTIKYYIHREQNLDKFDYLYSFEPDDIVWAEEKLGINVRYLPLGVSEEIYCGRLETNQEIYDISFVGQPSENRLLILDKIAEYCDKNNKNMVVYGHYWHDKHWWQRCNAKKKFAKYHPSLVKYVHNEFLYGKDVAELYAKSAICLNIHKSLHEGINPRTFEILGNGNFELCDYRKDAEQFGLVDKHNIALFNDSEDCVKQIDYYLKNEVMRKVIGKRGKETVKDKYTITKLLSEVIEKIKG